MSSVSKCGLVCVNRSTNLNADNSNECVFSPPDPNQKRPAGLKYEKAKEWQIPCVNVKWLGDILLGNFEALQQTQYGCYTTFGLQDPFAPTPHLVVNLLDEQNYLLQDAEAEVLFSFSLEESLRRAHVSPLFKVKYFYITPGICPSLSTMKMIMECAGGKVLSKQPSFRKLMEHKEDKSLSEILIFCENDLHLCQEYFSRGLDVHNAEFVLTGVLTQTLDYESYPLGRWWVGPSHR
ncbi:hypothetical protein G4228_019360 [Cervus hanglu yarkandensis]|nr:hypothetical protein G4228_019360 [Cervus hanglu yarkandensis]